MASMEKELYKVGLDCITNGDYSTAKIFLEMAKKRGYIDAYDEIGHLYYNGHGVCKSTLDALSMWQEGYAKGSRLCARNIGIMYYQGIYFEKNIQKAIDYFLDAYLEEADSAFYLGTIKYKQSEIKEDYYQAISYYEKAAELGRIDANLQIGNIYFELNDYKRAFTFYSKDLSSEAYYNLAVMYENGIYVEKDIGKALSIFTKLLEIYPEQSLIRDKLNSLINFEYEIEDIRVTEEFKVSFIVNSERSTLSKIEVDNRVDSLVSQLNDMIGLESIKSRIDSLVAELSVRKARDSRGLKTNTKSYHMVFTGNAGTGKTVVARLVAKIFYYLGVVKNDKFVECTRADLVASYVGQTAVQTNEVVDSAIGGVLFIDEAYALNSGGENDFGKEAIATLLKRIEDERDNLIVIIAGYKNEMSELMLSNQGLESRFGRTLDFEDYNNEALMRIFYKFCIDNKYFISNSLEQEVINLIKIVREKKANFANARDVRNIYERVTEALDMRIYRMGNINNIPTDEMQTITLDDISIVSTEYQ